MERSRVRISVHEASGRLVSCAGGARVHGCCGARVFGRGGRPLFGIQAIDNQAEHAGLKCPNVRQSRSNPSQ